MPYIYAQSKIATTHGWPMTRALFLEFPEDRGSWEIENEYMFGSDILVAPLFEEGQAARNVYLPPGKWIDYQSGKLYSGGWHLITPGEIEAIILIKEGSIIPFIKIAQSTQNLDWSEINLRIYSSGDHAMGSFLLPDAKQVESIAVNKKGSKFVLSDASKRLKPKFNLLPVNFN